MAIATLTIVLFLTSVSLLGSSEAGGEPSSGASPTSDKTLKSRATIYPNRLNGHKTASGQTFRQAGHSAASNVLPPGTHVTVTNLQNGKSTHVTVTDRGRALGGRRIDLSKKAADEIGLTRKKGVAPVQIKVLRTPNPRETPPG
jgi:rare lipoprotein A